MAKVDLILNEDFLAYQQDLITRRDSLYVELDALLSKPDYSPEWSHKIFAVRHTIKEYDGILDLPEYYALNAAKSLKAADKSEAPMVDKAKRLRAESWSVRLKGMMRAFGGK